MDFKSFRKELRNIGLDVEAFSKETNIPIRTIQNWFTTRKGKQRNQPNWVIPYINLHKKLKKETERLKNIIEYLEEKQNEKH